MKKIIFFFLLLPISSFAQDISCKELLNSVKNNTRFVDTALILSSSVLSKAEYYEYEGTGFVIAYIKKNNYDLYPKPYIYCNILTSRWRAFKRDGAYGSYGKAFHKYIIDYKCNCTTNANYYSNKYYSGNPINNTDIASMQINALKSLIEKAYAAALETAIQETTTSDIETETENATATIKYLTPYLTKLHDSIERKKNQGCSKEDLLFYNEKYKLLSEKLSNTSLISKNENIVKFKKYSSKYKNQVDNLECFKKEIYSYEHKNMYAYLGNGGILRDENFQKILEFDTKTYIKIIKEDKYYIYVNYNNLEGKINKNYIAKISESNLTTDELKLIGFLEKGGILRDINFNEIVSIPPNKTVKLISKKNKYLWYVKYNNFYGFINQNYISR